ncbi:MAG: hypothetical protein LBH25_10515 [Fibromonadaceae bacterium]|jgi:hypothetical protein|nr:hypothetical protein [Fibromonadaceae bacterium]
METKLNSKGKRFFAPAIAAGLMLAMAFTLSACGGDQRITLKRNIVQTAL